MYKFLFSLLFVSIFAKCYSQDKKVAVVTMYADKRVDLSDFGLEMGAENLRLDQDPNFNLSPVLNDFHTQFINEYSKSFPFQLVPETEVLNNPAYRAYVPDDDPGINKIISFTPAEGYKVIEYFWRKNNEQNLLQMFHQYDGIMFVSIGFKMVKSFAIGGAGAVKVEAYARMILLNKDDKKVFDINETANSKKTAMMLGGVPVMTPDKVLPMCESAMTELMEALQKKLPKIIKKTEEKL